MSENRTKTKVGAERRRLESRTPQPLRNDFEIDFRNMFLFFFRRRVIILGATVITVVFALFYTMFKTPEYVATNVMQLNTNSGQIIDMGTLVKSSELSAANAKQTEIDILRSRQVAGRVIDTLNLVEDAEFNPAQKEKGLVSHMLSWVKQLFVGEDAPLTAEEKAIQRSIAVSNLLHRFSVGNHPRSKTVDIEFRSVDPQKAALVANTLANEYMLYQMDIKYNMSQKANEWLNTRLEKLRQKVKDSEIEVQKFREEHELYEAKGVALTEQQVSELNSQLILAKANRAEEEARLKIINQMVQGKKGVEASSEVLDSVVIQRLRLEQAEVLRRHSEISKRYGPKHPRMINLQAEMVNIEESINKEIAKVVSNLKNKVQVAKSREKALKQSLNSAQGNIGASSEAAAQLSSLMREMEANQKLFEAFLTRFKEVSQQQDVEQADARVIAMAEAPLSAKYPRSKFILLIALVLGGMIGTAIAMLIEKLDNGFRSLEELEKKSAFVGLGLIPRLGKKQHPARYILQKVTSEFAESIRSVMTGIHYSNTENPPKTIMVTSSVVGEGKSSMVLVMARIMAKSGRKVLVIDCDMRRPSIAKELGVRAEVGLFDFLTQNMSLTKVTAQDKQSGMDVIYAKAGSEYSQELLSSDKMKALIKTVREKYDYVFLDTPPIAAVSDALVLAPMVDTTLYVVQWEQTPKPVVLSMLKKLRTCRTPVAGVVLTQVDMEKGREYGYGDCFKEYKEYYNS